MVGWALKGVVVVEGSAMAGVGDYLLDLIWVDQPPPWESDSDESNDNKPCP